MHLRASELRFLPWGNRAKPTVVRVDVGVTTCVVQLVTQVALIVDVAGVGEARESGQRMAILLLHYSQLINSNITE